MRRTVLDVSVGVLVFAAVILVVKWGGRLGAGSAPAPASASAGQNASSAPANSMDMPGRVPEVHAPADRVLRVIFSPLGDPDRRSFANLRQRVSGLYGEYRKSYMPGHLHAGIDINGPFKGQVHPIGKGRVHLVFREFPHLSVAVEHTVPDGSVLYSMYVHVMDVKVAAGDEVDETTVLARLFDAEELAKAGFGTANHLHLEIRSSLDDGGWASASSMTLEALNRYCRNPLAFFKRHLH